MLNIQVLICWCAVSVFSMSTAEILKQTPEKMLCESVTITVYPIALKAIDFEFKSLLKNTKVVADECRNVGSACWENTEPKGSCEQAFRDEILPSLNDDGTIVNTTFKIPSGCMCSLPLP